MNHEPLVQWDGDTSAFAHAAEACKLASDHLRECAENMKSALGQLSVTVNGEHRLVGTCSVTLPKRSGVNPMSISVTGFGPQELTVENGGITVDMESGTVTLNGDGPYTSNCPPVRTQRVKPAKPFYHRSRW